MERDSSLRRVDVLWTTRLLLLAALSGGLLALAFPPSDLGFVAWVALVPLMVALSSVRRLREGALLGAVTGVVFFALLLLYIGQYGALPWAALALFQGSYMALFGLLTVGARRVSHPVGRAAALAGAWAFAEWLRGHAGALAFTFGGLAYSQYRYVWVIQFAALLGPYGLSALIAFANAALAVALRPGAADGEPTPLGRRWGPLVLAGGGLVLLAVWGHRHAAGVASPGAGQLNVVAVQANYEREAADARSAALDSLELHEDLTRAAAGKSTELIVWSETAIPSVLNRDPRMTDRVGAIARRHGAYVLIGAPDQDARGRLYNGMSLFSPEGRIVGRYHKVRLVVFGEYVPFREQFPFLGRYPIRGYDYTAGRGHHTLTRGDVRLGPMICFESIFPEVARTVTRRGADVLVLITSDSWAGRSAELQQHVQCSVLRAAETARPVVRSASTGVTCLIAPGGRILADAPRHCPATVAGSVPLGRGLTPYARWGDWPVMIWVIIGAGCVVGALRRSRAGQADRHADADASRRKRGKKQ